ELARNYVAKLEMEPEIGSLESQRVLDFGAGTGAMSKALEERGAEVHSVDPFAYDLLESSGHNAYKELRDLPASIEFDGAVAVEVLEHVPHPDVTLGEIASVLSERGWLYLSTPNRGGLNARMFRGSWREIDKAGHLYFFDPKSIHRLLSGSGFIGRRRSWAVDYHAGMRGILHRILVSSRLDGALRVIAIKDPRGYRETAS
ncbi:MAG: class I SAM-dependent methyltransferase, partial [Acidimicrobiia bacterium]